MASKKKIYVVTMFRYGDREMHSYVLGAFTKKKLAMDQAEQERIARGGNKYSPEILEFNPNQKHAHPEKKCQTAVLPLGCEA